MNALLEDLKWRGLIANSTDEDALAAHLDAGPITSYVGFDPTAPSLHVGHLMQLGLARRLQEAGHRPLLLVGGATGLIGDPKETGERVMNPEDVVADWTERLRGQVSRYVDLHGSNGAIVVSNYDWIAEMPVLEYLRDVGKYFPVNRMLARDVVARRLEEGISYTEFSYVLLQSIDYAELHRRYNCTLQTGAQDQWGNITAGIDYIRRRTGDVVHGLVTPLLTKSDGTKFGKTEGGSVWLDPELTSPYAFYQFWLNVEDAKVVECLKLYSKRSHEEIMELAEQTRSAPHLRAAQRALAAELTDLVHGVPARREAEAAAGAVFGNGDLRQLSPATLVGVFRELGGAEIRCSADELPLVTEALVASGVVGTKSAARRAIQEGGAYVNNVRIADVEARLKASDLLAGEFVLLRRGKRTVGAVRVARG